MPWVAHTDFGRNLIAVDAFSPFPISGGNQVLSSNASGAVYENSISAKNIVLSCDFTTRVNAATSGGSPGSEVFFILGRVQSDGSFYSAALRTSNFSSRRISTTIHIYNGISNTFTQLGHSFLADPDPNIPAILELVKMEFSLIDTTLTSTIIRNNTTAILNLSVTDSTITTAGNPGLGAHILSPDDTQQGGLIFIDNFQVSIFD